MLSGKSKVATSIAASSRALGGGDMLEHAAVRTSARNSAEDVGCFLRFGRFAMETGLLSSWVKGTVASGRSVGTFAGLGQTSRGWKPTCRPRAGHLLIVMR